MIVEEGQTKLLTVKDVAKRLQLSIRTVRSYISDKVLRVVHFGRAVRVTESELQKFIADRTS